MKTILHQFPNASQHPLAVCAALWLLSTLNSQLSTFAQGSLTPPGAPTPTMKTLAQIEPRTPISSLPFTITNAGSYYLATNLTGISGAQGVTISASAVTLDLGGFALTGVAGSTNGVFVTGAQNDIAIVNGTITQWGQDGVDASSSSGGRFTGLIVSGNGHHGLWAGSGAVVRDCVFRQNGGNGLSADVASRIAECAAYGNTGTGIGGGVGSTLTGCSARNNGGIGITSGTGSTISGCSTHYNGTGIYVNNNCYVLNNNVYDNSQGIAVVLDNNRIDGNNVTSCSGAGVSVGGAGNIVIRNTARANNPNYSIAPNNTVGELLDFSSGGGTLTNASP